MMALLGELAGTGAVDSSARSMEAGNVACETFVWVIGSIIDIVVVLLPVNECS